MRINRDLASYIGNMRQEQFHLEINKENLYVLIKIKQFLNILSENLREKNDTHSKVDRTWNVQHRNGPFGLKYPCQVKLISTSLPNILISLHI